MHIKISSLVVEPKNVFDLLQYLKIVADELASRVAWKRLM